MKKGVVRITSIIAAFALGITVVILLLFAGQSVKGPLHDFFDFTGKTVTKVEKKLIIDERTDKRAAKLEWLKRYDVNALKNPDRIFFGAYDNNTAEDFDAIVALEDSLTTTFPFIHIYCAWGDEEIQRFPRQNLEAIRELGSIPFITWEPWLTSFDKEKHPSIKEADVRDKDGLRSVAEGQYDFYLTQWAREAAQFSSPIFLRVGHEMNDAYRYPWGPQNNSPKEFIDAWRHVHDVFKNEGAKNVVWVWSPHPAYGSFKEYFPGESYVDYVGSGVLNYGTAATWSKWWTFQEIFGNYYKELAAFNKPIVIAEFGSLAVGGNRAAWFKDALDSVALKYPRVKSIIFFHYSDDRTTTQQTLDWYFTRDKETLSVLRSELQRDALK